MLDNNRHQHFKKVLYDLLSSQDEVAVLKVNNEMAARPHCWIRAAFNDSYEAVRGDSGPVLSNDNRHVFYGVVEFAIYARFDIPAMDTGFEGTLEDEGGRVADILEWAIKYGGTVAPFETDNYRIEISEVMPLGSAWWSLENDLLGMVSIKGHIRYKQIDL